MPYHTFIVKMTIKKPERRQEVIDAMLANVGPTYGEEGCVDYIFYQDQSDSDVIICYENWKKKEHLEAHRTTEHIKAFFDKYDDCVGDYETYDLTRIS